MTEEQEQTGNDVEEEGPSREQVLEDARDDALDFLEGLLDAMEADGDVVADIAAGGSIAASIEGGDVGLLIGNRGQTLDGIQELLRTAVQRQAQSKVRISLDVEGYRDRRRESLARQAREAAERALEGVEVEMDAMGAYDRKVVHETIAPIEGLETFSEGQEPRRRVVVRPLDE
ncbi:MAG: R3H domain-containing nucleic acid-binding protein [Actinomycetota bacterium]